MTTADAPEVTQSFVDQFHEAMASAPESGAVFQGDSVELMKMSVNTCFMDIPGDQVQITVGRIMAILGSLKGRTIKEVKYDSTVDNGLNKDGLVGTFTLHLEPENVVLSA